MIISYKYKFIFIKTAKTEGTSIEVFLDPICDPKDVFTPFSIPEEGHNPRNYRGLFNPLPEITMKFKLHRIVRPVNFSSSLTEFFHRIHFYHHIPAWQIKKRIPLHIWDGYFKFCVERNPFDKMISGWFWYKNKNNSNLTLDEYISLCSKRIEARNYGVGTCPFNYYNYSDPVTGKQIVDKIIYYENLVPELDEIFSSLGIEQAHSFDTHAKSGFRDNRHYREIINLSQRSRIEDLFKEEIKLHGYHF